MNQKEAEKIVLNYLDSVFVARGFQQKKKYGGFVKLKDGGYDRVSIGFFNYWPLQEPTYSIAKRFTVVEDINKLLSDKFSLGYTTTPIDYTFWFSYASIYGKHTNSWMPAVGTEEEMLDNAKNIEEFMINVGFPMLEKYNTLQAIDAEINGDDFWPTDWQHKFTLGGGFFAKRLIIAKLCNNPRFELLYKFHLDRNEEIKSKNPDDTETIIEGYNSFQYLVEVLLKDVKPIVGL